MLNVSSYRWQELQEKEPKYPEEGTVGDVELNKPLRHVGIYWCVHQELGGPATRPHLDLSRITMYDVDDSDGGATLDISEIDNF